MKFLPCFYLTACLSLLFTRTYAQAPHNFYYGNLHAHTGYSDGSVDSTTSGISTPYQAYQYAKASLNFDFLGISEHNHYGAGMIKPRYAQGLQQADLANDDSSFVALFGMEWGTISSGGHVLIYGYENLIGWEGGNFDEYVARGNYANLWRKVNARSGAFATCAHPNNNDFGGIANRFVEAGADSALVGTAFRSGPAFSTNISYSNQSTSSYETYYRRLLSQGYHVAPTYDHDNHYTTFGRHTEGRLVVLAPALTRADLMESLRNRQFYASDDWNTEVTFLLNGQHHMGTITHGLQHPVLQVTVADGDGETPSYFQLYRGTPGTGQFASIAATVPAGTTAITFTDTLLTLGETAYYYAVITQPDNDKIITAPIWYTRGSFVSGTGAAEPQQELNVQVWPNPVQSGSPLTLTAPAQSRVLFFDALGRQVKQELVTRHNATFSTHDLQPGLYTLLIAAPGAAPVAKRLVVQ